MSRSGGSGREVTFLVVRHGETVWNREGRIQGHGDSPLTERGLAQAREVAGRLAREPVAALYASDLGRARETARLVAASAGMEVKVDPGLRERAFGVLEGRTWDEIEREDPGCVRRLAEDPGYAAPGGESLAQFRDRVTEALARISRTTESGRAIAVITHGGVLGVLWREARRTPPGVPLADEARNASVNEFRYTEGRWAMVRWGEADHLGAPSE